MKLDEWDGEVQEDKDLNMKFAETFVQIRGEKGPHTVYIDSIGARLVFWRKVEEDRAMSPMCKTPLEEIDIISAIPKSGVYQFKDSVLLLRRNPMRQWAEGLCDRTCVVRADAKTPLPISVAVASACFKEQKNEKFEEAYENIKPGQSVRLTSHYWLQSSKAEKRISLMRTNARIGSWVVGKFFWSSKGKLFKEELKDELEFHA